MPSEKDDPLARLREVAGGDIEIFFRHQLDPEASAMAAFPARDRPSHRAHWNKILGDPTIIARTIVVGDEVAGNIVSWIQDEHREIGYWIDKIHWGKGIATAAVREFANIVTDRPLYAAVAEHNAASIRVLEKAGFVRDGWGDEHVIYKLH